MVSSRVGERKIQRDEARLSGVGSALQAAWSPPTDTMITDDIPLLLTRLSQISLPPRSR